MLDKFLTPKAELVSEILAVSYPSEIFSNDKGQIEKEYKQLSKVWHPDVNLIVDSKNVFIHIKKLYDEAIDMIDKGVWEEKNILTFKDRKASNTYKIHYKKHHKIEIGDMYVADKIVAFIIDKSFEDLIINAELTILNFQNVSAYASHEMEKEVSRYLPKIIKSFETTNDKFGIIISKTPDLLLLKDVLDYFTNNPVENWDRSAAWIISTLHNLCCYFEYAKIVNCQITTETYFISPEFHSGALLGGWFYSAKEGEKLTALSQDIYNLVPKDIQISKIADSRIDLESIRAIGRELLGDITGGKLCIEKKAPDAMINWLKCSSSGSALKDYQNWNKCLTDSFGPRKFIPMNLTSKQLYE